MSESTDPTRKEPTPAEVLRESAAAAAAASREPLAWRIVDAQGRVLGLAASRDELQRQLQTLRALAAEHQPEQHPIVGEPLGPIDLPAPSASVNEAASALLARLDLILEHPAYIGVFAMAELHGGPYRGPQCADEMVALRVALAAAPRDAAREEAERDRIHAQWYRALRAGAILGLSEENDLILGVDIAAPDEDDDDGERPCTERNAPFLTEIERSDLNGDRPDSKGHVRGDDAIDRAAEFVRAARRGAS